jgi:hypothetical protein
MLKTGAISTTQRPQGGIGVPKLTAGALFIFLLFAGFFATAQRAGADTGIPASGVTGAIGGLAAEVPAGSTAVSPPAAGTDPPQAPVDPAQPVAQDAATAQAATTDAAAAQPQQSNGIGATRTDSSGDESVSQENDVSVVGAAANAASTRQAADPGPPSADGAAAEAGQQATTDEASNAAAAAVQPQQSNVVIIIRINSPGDDVISQTNVVSVVAVGGNQASTSQDPAAAVASALSGTSDSSPPSAAISAPPPVGQSAPAGGRPSSAKKQPQHPGDVIQQLHPQGLRALSILAFTASSDAGASAPEHQATSPTTSASRPRPGGVAGRSGAFGNAAAEGTRVASNELAIRTSRHQVHRTGAQGPRGAGLGALRDDVASWLGWAGAAASPQFAADSAGGMKLGVLALTALLVGLVGLLAWAALSWPPFPRL